MPQDFAVGADNQQISAAKLESLRKQAKENGEVFPYDNVKVYATQKLIDLKAIPEINKVGHEFEVHSAVADKMERAGKITKEKPAEEKAPKK